MDEANEDKPVWTMTRAQRGMLRTAAVRRLLGLREREQLTTGHVTAVADFFEVHPRTVWRWVQHAVASGKADRPSRARFRIDAELLVRYAYHRGNAAGLHRELTGQAAADDVHVPSLATVERAIRRDLTPGQRAGVRKGERARRGHDVYLRRPDVPRNTVWEGDHVEASNWVDIDGELRKPWITWFIDCGTCALLGAVITPCYPSREAVLVALRVGMSRQGRFGAVGGLPDRIRIDRGKDFLSRAVVSAMAAFAVEVSDLPGYSPYLKGRIEAVNLAVKTELFSTLPRYTKAPVLVNNKPSDPNAPPLPFAAFVAEVFGWITAWNTAVRKPGLGGRTPIEAWTDDPTPVTDVPERDLVLFTLEDDGKTRPITTKGVSFLSRSYVGPCMVGRGGEQVRVRWLPNHPEIIEIFSADTGDYLGPAHPSDEADPEQVRELLRARRHEAKHLKAVFKAADRSRRVRYAAATDPTPPQILGSVSAVEAEAAARNARPGAHARPDLFPLRPPASSWALPRPPRTTRAPEGAEDGSGH